MQNRAGTHQGGEEERAEQKKETKGPVDVFSSPKGEGAGEKGKEEKVLRKDTQGRKWEWSTRPPRTGSKELQLEETIST